MEPPPLRSRCALHCRDGPGPQPCHTGAGRTSHPWLLPSTNPSTVESFKLKAIQHWWWSYWPWPDTDEASHCATDSDQLPSVLANTELCPPLLHTSRTHSPSSLIWAEQQRAPGPRTSHWRRLHRVPWLHCRRCCEVFQDGRRVHTRL